MERLLVAFLRRYIRRGTFQVTTAAGNGYTFGDGSGAALAVRFRSANAQRAVLFDPELKLGEAYMDGSLVVEHGSIADVLDLLLRQEPVVAPRWASPPHAARLLCRRLQQFNPRSRARRNAAHHYDLDGRLYGLFLDGDQQYSCAYFESPDVSLDDAQLAKKRHLAAKLLIEPGASVLDIGCWDGFFSFDAVRRGASRVLASDHFAWSRKPGAWGDRRAFELARMHLAPQVEMLDADIDALVAQLPGVFDFVLFSGVLYHLRHPLKTLEQIAPLVGETLVIETHLAALDIDQPAMIFYPGSELAGDATNWWGPNVACVEALLRDVGFSVIDYQPHSFYSEQRRGIFHAQRQ